MPRCRSKDGATVRVARRAASIWADVATVADIGQLHLTSPAMDGPHVRSAQRALLHNPFGTFDPGTLDGIYGERPPPAGRRGGGEGGGVQKRAPPPPDTRASC